MNTYKPLAQLMRDAERAHRQVDHQMQLNRLDQALARIRHTQITMRSGYLKGYIAGVNAATKAIQADK